jgi:FMN phosphatase YigB (HAD superfamily)
MVKVIISDLSRVILFPKEESYTGKLNDLYQRLQAEGDYDFWSYFKLDMDLFNFYKKISKNIDVYIFTSKYIQEHPALRSELEPVFKAIFSAIRLNLTKADPESYKFIADKIGLKPEEILYVDDNKKNLDAAKKSGMSVIGYESNEQIIKDINEIITNRKCDEVLD